jgi:hypothetical protein
MRASRFAFSRGNRAGCSISWRSLAADSFITTAVPESSQQGERPKFLALHRLSQEASGRKQNRQGAKMFTACTEHPATQ